MTKKRGQSAARNAPTSPTERSSSPESTVEVKPKERFTVMRVVLPVSQKAFCYAEAKRMGLDTPSAYVRLVLKELQEARAEFEYEKHGFDEDDEPQRSERNARKRSAPKRGKSRGRAAARRA